MPAAIASCGLSIVTGLPLTRISPPTIGSIAEEHARQRAAAAAEQAGHADHLAAMHVRLDVARLALARRRRAARAAARRSVAVLPPHVGEAARAAADDVLDHRLAGVSSAQRRGDDVLAVAQDRRAVGDARDLVHAVRDVDDRHALGLEPAQEVEQLLDLAARQRRGRLVEDQHLARCARSP